MNDGKASSYFQPRNEKSLFWTKENLLRKFHYWNIIPILKILKRKKITAQARTLLKHGLIETTISGFQVRYAIKNSVATFDVSPDNGKSFLNYLQGTLEGEKNIDIPDVINSIATIEAMIRTGHCVKY
jgi:hypothetical protein